MTTEVERLRLDLRIAWEDLWIAQVTTMRREALSCASRCDHLAERYTDEKERAEAAEMSRLASEMWNALDDEWHEATERARVLRARRREAAEQKRGGLEFVWQGTLLSSDRYHYEVPCVLEPVEINLEEGKAL